MIPFGSVPVASSHVLTSPIVALLSLILPRMASVDDQNMADSGLPAASSPRLMLGSDPRASADGTDSRASATSRLVRALGDRAASSATRSASRFTSRRVRLFRPERFPSSEHLAAAQVGPQHGRHGHLSLL